MRGSLYRKGLLSEGAHTRGRHVRWTCNILTICDLPTGRFATYLNPQYGYSERHREISKSVGIFALH